MSSFSESEENKIQVIKKWTFSLILFFLSSEQDLEGRVEFLERVSEQTNTNKALNDYKTFILSQLYEIRGY